MESNKQLLPIKVLLVEDNIVIAEMTKFHLEMSGFEVCHEFTGEQAIENLNKGEFRLILMDIHLGKGIDGFETARQIQENDQVPIIFYSSETNARFIDKARQISPYGYVIKDGTHYALLNQVALSAIAVFELYQLHQLKQAFLKDAPHYLNSPQVIAALINENLEYTWINNPHPDFMLTEIIGKTDVQIAKNTGARKLYELKEEVLIFGKEICTSIEFSLSNGAFVYEIQASPMLQHDGKIIGVKTMSIVKS